MLSKIIKAGARTITTYTYDGDDLRTSKTTKSSANNYQPITTNYQYDRQHVILETDATDAIKARYVRGINYIARIDAANKISYYLYNGHGDIVQIASGLGAVENQYDYDIFGNPILTIEQYANAIRYVALLFKSGKKMDEAINALDDGRKCIATKLFQELDQAGVKYAKEAIVGLVKTPSGNVNWLEIGNDKAGLQHIMKRHATEFSAWGLTNDSQVGDFVLRTISNSNGVADGGSIIYDVTVNGVAKKMQVVIGDNGFIVTAHPYTPKK